MTFRTKALRVIVIAMFFWALSSYCSASGQSSLPQRKAYALQTWSNLSCRAKGRFQDREYCSSAVIDQIVADGKSSIPVLISQITDSRWIAEPVYDYWPRIRTGELAYFILDNLFLDDTWEKSTMPPLFPQQKCGLYLPRSGRCTGMASSTLPGEASVPDLRELSGSA